MKVAVWDTYVSRDDGKTMHFDIIVPETLKNSAQIYSIGNDYLSKKSFKTGRITSRECRYCHIEKAPDHIEAEILENGFYIYEMEHCH